MRALRLVAALLVLSMFSRPARADEGVDGGSSCAGRSLAPSTFAAAPRSATRPRVGDSAEVIEAYLARLERVVRAKRKSYREARRGDRDDLEQAAEAAWREAKRFEEDETSRLTEQDGGLIAGGVVVVGLGSASLIAAVVFGVKTLAAGLGSGESDGYESLGYATAGLFGGGLAGVAIGGTMLGFGVKSVPRKAVDGSPDAATGRPATPTIGMTLQLSF